MAGLVSILREHQIIGFDTSIFIYQLKNSPEYGDLANDVFEDLAAGRFTGLTSIVTIMELMVRPFKVGRPDIAHEYHAELYGYPHLRILHVDRETAWKAAELRASHRLQPADALQIATCLHHGGRAFLTNDRILRRVSDLPVLLLSEFL